MLRMKDVSAAFSSLSSWILELPDSLFSSRIVFLARCYPPNLRKPWGGVLNSGKLLTFKSSPNPVSMVMAISASLVSSSLRLLSRSASALNLAIYVVVH